MYTVEADTEVKTTYSLQLFFAYSTLIFVPYSHGHIR